MRNAQDLEVENDERIPITDDDFNRSMEKRIQQVEEIATKFTETFTTSRSLSAIEVVCIIFPIIAVAYLTVCFSF